MKFTHPERWYLLKYCRAAFAQKTHPVTYPGSNATGDTPLERGNSRLRSGGSPFTRRRVPPYTTPAPETLRGEPTHLFPSLIKEGCSLKANGVVVVWLFVTLTLLFSSCHKDPSTNLPTGKGVYIVNEGLFNFGQGEVSYYNPTSNEVTNGLFHSANNFSLGDVAQSMYIKDSTGFIVVNNSAKIEVVRIPSLKSLRTITIAGSSPRNFLPLNDSIAYVTELFAKKIWVINYQTGALITTISNGGWTEDLFKIDNDVFVEQKINTALTGTVATVLKVNTSSHTEQHNTTFGGRDVNGITKDKLDRIWVAVDEDTAHGLYAGFYCFDKNLVEQKSFFYTTYHHHPSRLCINGAGDKLIFSDTDVFTFSINDNTVPLAPVISGSGKNIYGMAVNPFNDDIYMSDVLDYVQASKIYRYDKNGGLIHSFTAGVISGNFAFNE